MFSRCESLNLIWDPFMWTTMMPNLEGATKEVIRQSRFGL